MRSQKYGFTYQRAALSGYLVAALRAAREEQKLSQRELGVLVGIPQGHISRIEAGAVDLQLSSLVELARALGMEVVLVPRKAIPAVRAVVGTATTEPSDALRPAYALDGEDDLGESERHDLA